MTDDVLMQPLAGARLEVGQRVRSRVMESVRLDRVQLPDVNRVAHLQFRRFAGCPICNVHLQSIAKRHDEIVAAGVVEIVVFHTSAAEMREHADLPFHVIPDPTRVLYKEFGVEPSLRSVFSWAFWPAALRGLLSRKSRPSVATLAQGGPFGLPADFLISPSGRVLACKYGQHANDQWSVDELLSLVRRPCPTSQLDRRSSRMARVNPVHGIAVLISLCLGATMLASGLLKLIDPFASSYTAQLSASGLPAFSRPFAIVAEALAGLLFVGAWALRGRLARRVVAAWMAASLLVVATMLVATYIHLHPDVPRAVLPLEIKSPVIPLSVLALAVVNLNALRRLRNPRALVERYGPWALVSGASAGIGAEFARQLAAEGFNIVLVARTKAKLEELAELIGRQYQVGARVVAVDLAGQAGIERVKAATEDIEVGLVVNSAGVATPGAFTWRSEDSVRYEYSVNAVATSLLTHHFGRRMVGRGRGAVVLVSSTFGHQPVPYFQHYAATKAFVASLGHALRVELKPKGVDVLVLSPGPTRTAMRAMPGIDFRKMPLLWMNTDSVVAAALHGLRSGKSEVVPGIVNGLMSWTGRRLASAGVLATAFGFLTRRAVSSTRHASGAGQEESSQAGSHELEAQ